MDLTEILRLFPEFGLSVSDCCLSGNEYAVQLYTYEGPVVILFNTGKVQIQGTNCGLAEGLKAKLEKVWPRHLANFRTYLRQHDNKLPRPGV
jgi:hypothetical protein